MWAIVGLAGAMLACGTRDRTPGTRNGSGAPNGTPRDTGINTVDPDGGATNLDGGLLVDAGPTEDAGPSADSGGALDTGTGPVNLDPSKVLSTLTPEEVAALCQEVVAAQGTESVVCNEEITIEPTTFEECVADQVTSESSCTVGQLQACLNSLQGDLCNFLESAACAAFFECG